MEKQNSTSNAQPAPKKSSVGRLVAWVGGFFLLAAGGFGGSFVAHQNQVLEQLDTSYELLVDAQDEWLKIATKLTSNAGAPIPKAPSDAELKLLRSELLATSRALAKLRPPDQVVASAALDYKAALEMAAGMINQHDGTFDSFQVIGSSLQHASNVGGELKVQVNEFSVDYWRKAWQAIKG